jgi:predicted HicB family RNase H-like nuclease
MDATMDRNDHYGYRVIWSADDQEFVGTCVEFPSLSHLSPMRAEALHGIEDLVQQVVADMLRDGDEPPRPYSERHYSGEFMTRVPGELHRRLVIEAAETGVSLNRLVSFKLALPITAGTRSTRAARKGASSKP